MRRRPGSLFGLLAALALAGCATPQVQAPLDPPPGFAGPRIEADAFVVRDGARLALRRWTPTEREPDLVIVALHGINDSSAAWRLAGPWWAERGAVTYAYDQRGFGRSPGRGVWPGGLMQSDLEVTWPCPSWTKPYASKLTTSLRSSSLGIRASRS